MGDRPAGGGKELRFGRLERAQVGEVTAALIRRRVELQENLVRPVDKADLESGGDLLRVQPLGQPRRNEAEAVFGEP